MKGKGHLAKTERLLNDEPSDICGALTTDPWDNMLLYEEIDDTASDEEGVY